jgi:hypothetical protein
VAELGQVAILEQLEYGNSGQSQLGDRCLKIADLLQL